jgi:dihydroneopterin triphosphate diphosphatase
LAKIQSQIIEICIFRIAGSEPEYLLLKRAADDQLYPDIWQLVTGTVKKKEKAVKAALRELKEETGLPARRMWTVPFVDSYFDIKRDTVQIVPVFAAEVDNVSKLHLSSEHQVFEWLKHPYARERVVWPGQRHILDVVDEFIAGGKEASGLLQILKT